MMHMKAKFYYGVNDTLKCQALELPYTGDDLSMFIILPDKSTSLAEVSCDFPDVFNSAFYAFVLFGKDDYVGLMRCNAWETTEEQNRRFTGFLSKKGTEVDHTLPGKTPSGETMNQWIRRGMTSLSRK